MASLEDAFFSEISFFSALFFPSDGGVCFPCLFIPLCTFIRVICKNIRAIRPLFGQLILGFPRFLDPGLLRLRHFQTESEVSFSQCLYRPSLTLYKFISDMAYSEDATNVFLANFIEDLFILDYLCHLDSMDKALRNVRRRHELEILFSSCFSEF